MLLIGLLAVHTAVFHEATGRAVLVLAGVAPVHAAVGAGFGHDFHCGLAATESVFSNFHEPASQCALCST